jgi:hypothetical protein
VPVDEPAYVVEHFRSLAAHDVMIALLSGLGKSQSALI